MKERIEHLSKEFSQNSTETQKLTKVFEEFSAVQDTLQPDEKFRKNLKQRLWNLQEIQEVSTHIQQRQYHLFAWVFASFLFIGGFLFFMSDTLFQTPILEQEQTIETPMIGEDISDTSAPLYPEDTVFDDSESTTQENTFQQESLSQDTNETSENIEEIPAITEQTDNVIQESSKQKSVSSDTLATEKKTSPSVETLSPETSPAQDSSVTNFSTRWVEDFSDDTPVPPAVSMMMESSVSPEQQDTSDFQNYCSEVWGIYDSLKAEPSCRTSGQLCYESEYTQTGFCFTQQDVTESDMEIILQELMNDVSE